MSINRVDQISTKYGDEGLSRNYVNEAFKKDHIVFETLGTMDELSSFLGLAYHFTKFEELKVIQRTIQDLNTVVATSPDHIFYERIKMIKEEDSNQIENWMAELLKKAPIEPVFCLPGSETSLGGAYIDVARAICRRAERNLVGYAKKSMRTDLKESMKYVNRLSDYLFVLARYLSKTE